MSSGSGASGASKVSKVSVQEQEYELTEYGFKRYNICGMRFEVTPNFAVKKAVGQGAYGLVCSGSNTDTGNKVAIKKIPKAFEDTIDCKRLLREIKILRHFRHDNVLGCVESAADAWPASAAQRLIGRGRPEPLYWRPSSGAERSLRSICCRRGQRPLVFRGTGARVARHPAAHGAQEGLEGRVYCVGADGYRPALHHTQQAAADRRALQVLSLPGDQLHPTPTQA